LEHLRRDAPVFFKQAIDFGATADLPLKLG